MGVTKFSISSDDLMQTNTYPFQVTMDYRWFEIVKILQAIRNLDKLYSKVSESTIRLGRYVLLTSSMQSGLGFF